MKISVKKLHDRDKRDNIQKTPEEHLDLVEQQRLPSGKFLYEYLARLR